MSNILGYAKAPVHIEESAALASVGEGASFAVVKDGHVFVHVNLLE